MQCTSPIKIRGGVYPCGHCLSCRIAKAREWSARLLHELAYWDKSVFVTLTYSDEFLPSGNTLRKSDLQKFFKRLRKSLNGVKIKYYACGEYGDNKQQVNYGHGFGRPHYHAIIFGLGQDEFSKQLIKDCWRFCLWSNFLDSKTFGTVTYDSCRYVSDYIFKKYNGEKAKELYLDKGIEVPFKICSQGLGLRYVEDNSDNLKNNMGFTLRGVPVQLPRYYVQKLGVKLIDDGGEKRFKQWQKYARLHNYDDSDVAELIESHARQREINVEKRTNLYHKGEL